MDDDYGADEALIEAMFDADPAPSSQKSIRQPVPQRLDRAPPPASTPTGKNIVQPIPQALPQKNTGSAILVSPRQRGNPLLTSVRSIPWEYSDIPADYVLGLTTCALFLSLKYHRLHPEYIYTRIRNLQGKYNLRILLTLVDIPNHEDSLRELSKTSLVNNVTIVLCWSAAEAARYVELYKSYENANFSAIRGQQASGYADKLVEFVTVPRSLNKSDAVALVANFGSLKNAINAEQEQLGRINGWGGVKVQRWAAVIDEPFRARRATKRQLQTPTALSNHDLPHMSTEVGSSSSQQTKSPYQSSLQETLSELRTSHELAATNVPDGKSGGLPQNAVPSLNTAHGDDDEVVVLTAAVDESTQKSPASGLHEGGQQIHRHHERLNAGVAEALAKLRGD